MCCGWLASLQTHSSSPCQVTIVDKVTEKLHFDHGIAARQADIQSFAFLHGHYDKEQEINMDIFTDIEDNLLCIEVVCVITQHRKYEKGMNNK